MIFLEAKLLSHLAETLPAKVYSKPSHDGSVRAASLAGPTALPELPNLFRLLLRHSPSASYNLYPQLFKEAYGFLLGEPLPASRLGGSPLPPFNPVARLT